MYNNKGFTLIELLVSIAMAGVLLAAVYGTFMAQNRSYKMQEQIVQMQQNLRGALTFMTREIRMAGADPLSVKDGSMTLISADDDSFHFTMDVGGGEDDDIDNDDDGDKDEPDEEGYPDGAVDPGAGEDITYALYDAYGDGDTDIGRDRNDGSNNQPVAENIDVLNFEYLDGAGAVLATPLSPNALLLVKTINLAIIARTDREDPDYTDTNVYSYVNQAGDTVELLDMSTRPENERRYRRQMVKTTIKLRNL